MYKKPIYLPGFSVLPFDDPQNFATGILFTKEDGTFRTAFKYDGLLISEEYDIDKNIENIKSLIFNCVSFSGKVFSQREELEEFISINFLKYTPIEKLNLILEYLYSRCSFEGEKLDLDYENDLKKPEIWRKFFMKNYDELKFYIENLKAQGLISYQSSTDGFHNLLITLEGLTRLSILEQNDNSRNCFVAMSFDENLFYIYNEAILPAIKETGFNPIIIRNVIVDPDRTISDEIIASIKISHFTIADFTQHKSGVYFEAGYALGRGQKVIYTCHKDDLAHAHFDTRNLQHLVWDNPESLKKMLIDRIEAYIKN